MKKVIVISTSLRAGSNSDMLADKFMEGALQAGHVNPEKPDVPLNKNDAFQKVQKRRVQEKR